jgi:endonuclease IV
MNISEFIQLIEITNILVALDLCHSHGMME